MSAVFQEFHQRESAPAFKLMSDSRNWYTRQSQMTVFGIAPSMQDVRQNFSDCLALAVGLLPQGRPSATPPLPIGRAALSSFEVK